MRLLSTLLIGIFLAWPALPSAGQAAPASTPSQAEPAANTVPPAPAPTLPAGRVTGSVFCSDTRGPARGAAVLLWAIPGTANESDQLIRTATAHVNISGTYTFEHLAPGDYVIVAILPGYLSALDDAPELTPEQTELDYINALAARNTVTVSTQGSTTANLLLERGAAISGRVLYSDGSPVTQATMTLENTSDKNKPVSEQPPASFSHFVGAFIHHSVNTDDLGHFRFSGVKPGTYRIAVTPPLTNDGKDTGPGQLGIASALMGGDRAIGIYNGDTFHKRDAKKYEIKGSEQLTGIELRIPLNAFRSVRGIVNAVDGRPINIGALTLTDTSDDTVIFHANLTSDGTFHFTSIPPGSYTLAATGAHIGSPPHEDATDQAIYERELVATNNFADGSTQILVQDSDLTGVTLSLTEVPMPKPPANPQPDTNE